MSALAQFSQQQKASSSRSWGVFGGSQSGSDFVDLEGGGASSSSSAASRGMAFFGGLRDKVVSTAQDYTPMSVSGALESTGSSIRSSVESVTPPSAESMQYFAMLLVVGIVLIGMSLMFLPVVVLAPQKFALLFSLGSTCICAANVALKGMKFALLFSLGSTCICAANVALKGMGPFLSFVFASERAAFGVGYCLSFVGVLYASLVQKSYFLTLFCVVAELVSLSYLLLSYVPGGTRFLNFVFSMVLSGCKMLCGRCLGGSDG